MLHVLSCTKNTPKRPKNANPSLLSEKNVYSLESLQFGRQGGNFVAFPEAKNGLARAQVR